MLRILFRTAVLYTALLLTVRLLGKRQLGQMEPSEFVVTMVLANLATVAIEDTALPLWNSLLPIGLIYAAEMLLSHLTVKSIKIRRFFCGKPVILIENGKISQENLRRTRISSDELTMQLREKGIFDLSTVKFAILETNGQLSTLLYAKEQPATAKAACIRVKDSQLPITLISDGRLLHENLSLSGKTEDWVHGQLKKRGKTLSQVFLMTVDGSGRIYFAERMERT